MMNVAVIRTGATHVTLVIALGFMGMCVGVVAPAGAALWEPEGAEVVIDSTNFSFTIGKEVIECGATAGEGTLGKASSTWTSELEFASCGAATVTAGSAWTATAINTGEATLTVPAGEAAGIKIELSAKCVIRIDTGATLGASGDYSTGTGGMLEPSTLAIVKQEVSVTGTSSECGESATKATVSANFTLQNFSKESGGESIRIIVPAAHPAFFTQSGKELLFSGEGTKPTLRGEQLGLQATVECEKILVDGFALHASSLAHRILISFHGKCIQKIGSGANETCEEPILAKRILAELGLLTSTNHKVVLLMAPADGTTTFAVVKCGGNTTTVGGVIVGEIPEKNAKGENQLNTPRSEIEVVFVSINKTNHQSITEIFLLGTQMTKDELSISGFFGGPGAEEATTSLKGDGRIEISTII